MQSEIEKQTKKRSLDFQTIPDSSINSNTELAGSSSLSIIRDAPVAKSSMKSHHPNCALCQNHGTLIRTKGHKRYCPWKNCSCKKCEFIRHRRKVVASQIAERRAMIEDMEREREMGKSINNELDNKNKSILQRNEFSSTPNSGIAQRQSSSSSVNAEIFSPPRALNLNEGEKVTGATTSYFMAQLTPSVHPNETCTPKLRIAHYKPKMRHQTFEETLRMYSTNPTFSHEELPCTQPFNSSL